MVISCVLSACVVLGNIVCPFGDVLKQMEFCHFNPNGRGKCIAPAKLILKNETVCGLNPQVECVCGFRGGRRICVPSKFFNDHNDK